MTSNALDKMVSSCLEWLPVDGESHLFFTIFENKEIILRLNDFPEEPLLSLIFENNRIDMDNWPDEWTLPRHRNQVK